MDAYENLLTKITERTAKTVVIGLGYVGLPLAVLHARAGFHVTGIDRNNERVSLVNRGRGYLETVSDKEILSLVQDGKLSATSEFSDISEADVVAICVPTPLDKNKNPDTTYIEYVTKRASSHLRKGQLIILESTTYPGTTENIVLPILESMGLEVGRNIFLAYSPERIDPGNNDYQVGDIPRVVGGVTSTCTHAASVFYEGVINAKVFTVSSPKIAEMSKLFENVFRVVNVSLVNELAQLCERMGIDVWEVIEAAKSKPYGFMPFYPGPGIGGHCIPIDPFFLSWKAREFGFTTRFVDLAGQINEAMPNYVVQKISEILNIYEHPLKGSTIALIGVAFKRDVSDIRESASIKVAEALVEREATLTYHDPHVESITIKSQTYHSVPLTKDYLSTADIVVIATDHTDVDYSMIVNHSAIIHDLRNALSGFNHRHIYKLGAPPLHD